MNSEEIANRIVSLYKEKGIANYSGEDITQLEHACQAAQLAESDGQDDEVVLAAFLHDIGHLLTEGNDDMDGYGTVNHELVGAEYLLARGFSEKLITLVKSHVEAKRYLCAVNQRYFDNLSHASKTTLLFQGGPMREDELDVFERNPLKNLIIKMRTWDEAAKEMNIPIPDLQYYKTKIISVLTA
jgi:phosphonate degradation associated HDIG domain protein